MIIFSGWKTFAVLALGGALMGLIGDSTVASLLIGAFIAGAGFWINAPKTAEDGTVLHESNSLFWIPLQYWGVAVIVAVLLRAVL